jgi:hypothetical protein
MKAGTLVKLTRSAIGIPLGSVGIITRAIQPGNEYADVLCEIRLIGGKCNGRTVRFLTRDLKAIK